MLALPSLLGHLDYNRSTSARRSLENDAGIKGLVGGLI
jgi:hypothetical protein